LKKQKGKTLKNDSSNALKEILDSIGLTRAGIARELGLTRDAVQRMIRKGEVPLQHIHKIQNLSARLQFEYDLNDERLCVHNFRIRHNSVLETAKAEELTRAGLNDRHDRENAYREAMHLRGDLKRFTDLQLKYELELRGWIVQEPRPNNDPHQK
jgi:transcriptional regulator with XRE-family HTH domain